MMQPEQQVLAALAGLDAVALQQLVVAQQQRLDTLSQQLTVLSDLVVTLQEDNAALRRERQQLREEIARLKGEQGQPRVPPQPPIAAVGPHSSEGERRQARPWRKSSKQDQIRVDREVVLPVDPAVLPPDAEFKGYEDQVVQDLVLQTDNVRFRKAVWHSASAGQSFRAALPAGYTGQFGPGLRALTLVLYYGGLMSEPKLLELYRSVGLVLSEGWLGELLAHPPAAFHSEAAAVLQAGLLSSPWQHLDDTPTRVNGQNWSAHILCNPLYTAYRTLPHKDRLSVLQTLAHWDTLHFRITDDALRYLAEVGVAQWVQQAAAHLPRDQEWEGAAFAQLLAEQLPGLGEQQHRWVAEAAALAAYRAQTDWPVVDTLVGDDAPQWKGVTRDLALCWVHEGRHYKKLIPYGEEHRQALIDFLREFWTYYHELRAYQAAPTVPQRVRLAARFAALFATETGYPALDDRIAKTRAKQERLLRVLAHPELPLHNNPAELGARQRVRKRDVSFGPRSVAGAQAWDSLQTLAATAQKLGVSFYHYVYDTLTGGAQLPRLADLITERAAGLQLGASWATP